jgi:hypothetical protein
MNSCRLLEAVRDHAASDPKREGRPAGANQPADQGSLNERGWPKERQNLALGRRSRQRNNSGS